MKWCFSIMFDLGVDVPLLYCVFWISCIHVRMLNIFPRPLYDLLSYIPERMFSRGVIVTPQIWKRRIINFWVATCGYGSHKWTIKSSTSRILQSKDREIKDWNQGLIPSFTVHQDGLSFLFHVIDSDVGEIHT